MAHDKIQRERLRALCGELHDDDGVDPREFFQPARKRDKARRKSKQLCRQVHKTLDLVFSGETGDELLGDLRIVSVTSGEDSSALLVTVVADVPPHSFDRPQIEARLASISGRLRCEVAGAITRKRTPVLVFNLLAPQTGIPADPELSADAVPDDPAPDDLAEDSL
jgi:ribosome-binding factor A